MDCNGSTRHEKSKGGDTVIGWGGGVHMSESAGDDKWGKWGGGLGGGEMLGGFTPQTGGRLVLVKRGTRSNDWRLLGGRGGGWM